MLDKKLKPEDDGELDDDAELDDDDDDDDELDGDAELEEDAELSDDDEEDDAMLFLRLLFLVAEAGASGTRRRFSTDLMPLLLANIYDGDELASEELAEVLLSLLVPGGEAAAAAFMQTLLLILDLSASSPATSLAARARV